MMKTLHPTPWRHSPGSNCAAGLALLFVTPFLAAGATFVVTSPADSGAGTLRTAITDANATPNAGGIDRIEFNLPTPGSKTITLFSTLPSITEPVEIDGTSQPGYSGTPIVELNGTSAGSTTAGLTILTSNCTVRGLVINRFRDLGIRLEGGGGHAIQGNFIGTDTSGANPLGNVNGGMLIFRSANNHVGGTQPGQRNLISGNAGTGLYLLDASSRSNRIEGNLIGTRWDGTAALPNGTNGLVIYNAPYNLIGGTTPEARNLISGNHGSGLYIYDIFSSSVGNVVQGNYIGTDLAGASAIPNTVEGIMLLNTVNILIGGTSPGAGNLVSGNGDFGILVYGPSASGNVIQGNRIGTDATGRLPVGNQRSGLGIDSASSTQVGGTLAAARNIIAANLQSGVSIFKSTAVSNRFEGNFIGVDATGTNALGNQYSGISIEGRFNTVGGTTAGAGNVISANGGHGVAISTATATANTVQGNRIGTDLSGTQDLGNGLVGVLLQSPANLVGGNFNTAGNTIAGNSDAGIVVLGAAGAPLADNVIQGNRIGTDLTGTLKLGNDWEGIYTAHATNTLIGGSTPELGNIISAHQGGLARTGAARGIRMANTVRSTIENNLIGTAIDRLADFGNAHHNIELEAGCHGNVIGSGPDRGNVIAHSGQTGIRIRDGCTNNLMLNNVIFNNTTLAIDLGTFQPNPNDSCDADPGANQSQNYPVLAQAGAGSGNVRIQGTLNSTPNRLYRLQFFSTPIPDPMNHGEADAYLGETLVTTAANCTASFDVTLPASVQVGHWVSATATDPDHNTSELALAIPIVNAGPTLNVSQPSSGTPGQLTFSWPDAATGYQLQATDSLAPPIEWTPVSGASIVVVDGQNTVTLDATAPQQYYRLVQLPPP